MNKNERQDNVIDVLKTFNNSITTCRLYPPEAPQVTAAVDRGYKSLKTYLRQNRQLQFALVADIPYLAGAPLHQDVLDSFANLHVYRQLRLLGLTSLTMQAEMDRFTFNQLLGVFHASVAKIKEEGGGLQFITTQGLASYFSDEPIVVGLGQKGVQGKERNLLKVRPELVACLLGTDKRPLVIEDLGRRIAVVDTGVTILASAIARILQAIRAKRKIIAATEFPNMLQRAEPFIPEEKQDAISKQLAELLIENMKDSALCVLLCQDFVGGFGKKLYIDIMNSLPAKRLGDIVIVFRAKIKSVRGADGKSPQGQLLGKSMLRLMNSDRGKQFLSSEKAKSVIHKGEKERIKKRFDSGVQRILAGDYSVIDNEEMLQALPGGLLELERKAGEITAASVLKHLIKYLGKGQDVDKKALLNCLLITGNGFIDAGHFTSVRILIEPLMLVVQRTSLRSDLLERVVSFLQKMMQAAWKAEDLESGDKILLLFFQIRSGQIEKSDQCRSIVAKVQDRGVERSRMPVLLKQCLAKPSDEALSYRLVLQGPIAIRYLVDALIQTEGSMDRLKIIDLLTYNSTELSPIIHERLPEHMPWYGKRNLIKLLAETGKEKDAEAVLGYLNHPDYRVQREAFLCVYKIGGGKRKHLFLEALDFASESVKIQLVEAFGSFCDQEVATRLALIMEDYTAYSEDARERLLLALIDTFSRCPCAASMKAMENFMALKEQKGGKNIAANIWGAAEKSLHFLRHDMQAMKKKHVQAHQLRKSALKQVSQKAKPAPTRRVITGLPEEQEIRNLLLKDEKKVAVSRLLLFIEQTARLRNFIQAEQLKNWLAEIDPGDPENVLRAGDIIVREKIATIDQSHLEVWSELYDALSTEEFTTVFENLRHKKYSTEESIVEQGAIQSALFFVNSGEVKMHYKDEGDDFFIEKVKSGEIFGADAFFEPSVWTMSVSSVGDSEVSMLPVEVLQQWSRDFPELEGKLLDFCAKFERVESLIIKGSRDRRMHKRHNITGSLSTALLDTRGRNTGITGQGEMIDISQGGIVYSATVENRVSMRQLLGRKVRLDIFTGEKTGTEVIAGDIVAVRKEGSKESDYSVHLKFDSLLSSQLLYEIIQANRAGTVAADSE